MKANLYNVVLTFCYSLALLSFGHFSLFFAVYFRNSNLEKWLLCYVIIMLPLCHANKGRAKHVPLFVRM